MEAHALEHPLAGLVGEPHVLKFDLAPDLVKRLGVGRVHHLRDDVEHRKDLLRRGEGALQHVKLLCQRLDRVEEFGDVHIERHDDARGDCLAHKVPALQITLAAEVEQAHHRGDIEHIHHRPEDAEHQNSGLLCLGKGLAAGHKVRHLLILAVEDLGDLDAGEVFRQIGVDVRCGVVHLAVDLSREFAEDHRKEHHKRHKAQNHKREHIVEHRHRRQYAEHHHRVFHQRHKDIGKHIGDGVGVVADSGHKLAHGDVGKLLVGELLDVGEHVHAHLRQNFLARGLQQHGLDVGANQAHNQNARIDRHHGKQPLEFKAALHQLLDLAHQQGGDQIVDDGEQHHQKDQNELLFVRPGIAQQPCDDLAVRHMAVKAHRVLFVFLQGIGNDEDQRKHADDGAEDQNRQILMHGPRLLPPPAAGAPPSSDKRGRFHTASHGCPQRSDGHPPKTAACPWPGSWRSGGQ